MGTGLVEAFDLVVLTAETPVHAPARSELPLVAEEIGKLARDGEVADEADTERGEALGVGEADGPAVEPFDGGERGGGRAGGRGGGGGGNPDNGDGLGLLNERRGGAAAAGLPIGDAGVAEITAADEGVAAPALRDREPLHDLVHVLVGDTTVVGPEGAGHDLAVGEIGGADDLAGVVERVGVDGVVAVRRHLGEHGTGLPIGEAVEAGGDAAVLRAAAELDGHRGKKIRPFERARGDAGG